MGAWNTSIMGDDLALDIREEFRELIADGLDPQQATSQIVRGYTENGVVDDEDEGPTFWLILAHVQWKLGRLQDEVRKKALAVIDSGGDLHRWSEDPKLEAKRRTVLEKLRVELNSPQRAPTKIRKEYRDDTDWKAGHAVAYQLKSGNWIVFRVLSIEEQKSRYPIVDICDWSGTQLPSAADIQRMPHRRESNALEISTKFDTTGKLALYAHREGVFPHDRLRVIATGLRFRRSQDGAVGACYFGGWSKLDEKLQEWFDLA